MGRIIKIVIGTIFLGISLFYFVGVCLVMADAKEDAVYKLRSYIRMEQTDCEYLGRYAVIDGDERTAGEGYGFYKMVFKVENLSSQPHYGEIVYLLDIERGRDGQEVRTVILPSDNDYDQSGFSAMTDFGLPGKTETEVVCYIEVKDGVDVVYASYQPNWDEERAELEIVLN